MSERRIDGRTDGQHRSIGQFCIAIRPQNILCILNTIHFVRYCHMDLTVVQTKLTLTDDYWAPANKQLIKMCSGKEYFTFRIHRYEISTLNVTRNGQGRYDRIAKLKIELVLFPDFWVSNIPRYFCFASFREKRFSKFTRGSSVASYLHEKQTSRIQSLYLYFIKIVPFWLRNIRFLIQNTRSLFYGRHYLSLHRLMSLHGKLNVKIFLMFIVADNTGSVNINISSLPASSGPCPDHLISNA